MPFEPDNHLAGAHRIGVLIRDFHDASGEFIPAAEARWNVVITPDAENLVIHHDLAPWNLVLGGERWVFIDWDNAGPGSPLWDLAYAAHGFIPLAPGTDVTSAIQRLAALADGYDLDEDGRSNLVETIAPRIMSIYDLLRHGHYSGAQPCARLWAEGHGRVWLDHAEYAERHLEVLATAAGDLDRGPGGWYDRGDPEFPTVLVADARIGILVCTDLWFFEWARHYARSGVDLLCLPRATPYDSLAKWLAGGQVAATCSGAYCMSSNQWNPSGAGIDCGGLGWVVDPDGNVLATTSAEEPFVTVEVDLDIARQAKSTYPRYVSE